MLVRFTLVFALLWALGLATSVPASARKAQGLLGRPFRQLFLRDPDVRDQRVLTSSGRPKNHGLRWTSRGFASLGDSYSAGIGTFVEGKEDSCRLGLGAYPALLYADLASVSDDGNDVEDHDVQEPSNATSLHFQWLSCTGATTDDVIQKKAVDTDNGSGGSGSGGGSGSSAAGQVDALNTSTAVHLDFITLSIGGNDLGFFDVINACVFRFYGLYSGPCQTALERAEALVGVGGETEQREGASVTADDLFSERLMIILLQLLERVRWERHPQFRVIVTGYARFFNEETTTCDTCSMSVWWWGGRGGGGEGDDGGNKTFLFSDDINSTLLTRELRRRMNGLVTGTNAKLRTVVDAVNARFQAEHSDSKAQTAPPVLFVDYDGAFDGHRFCEANVVEPDYERQDTWFFLVGGPDNRNSSASATDALLDPHSPLVDPDACLLPARTRGDWGELALCYMAQTRQAHPSLQLADWIPRPGKQVDDADDAGRHDSPARQNSMWYVPTYYGKTFHPRSAGHEAVRDALYSVWEEYGV